MLLIVVSHGLVAFSSLLMLAALKHFLTAKILSLSVRARSDRLFSLYLSKNDPDLEKVNYQTKMNSTYESRPKGFHQVTPTASTNPF